MKVWSGYGSEHSYRLVLIGRFADTRDAEAVEEAFGRLHEIASEEVGAVDWDDPNPGFSDALYEKLRESKAGNLSRADVDGFAYLDGLDRVGNTIRLRTDDAELQGLLKLMFDHGARVEIFSSHHWTEDGEPRGRDEDGGAAPDVTNCEPDSALANAEEAAAVQAPHDGAEAAAETLDEGDKSSATET